MQQQKPVIAKTSTTSVPFIGLAIVFALASFFVATSKAHSTENAVKPIGQLTQSHDHWVAAVPAGEVRASSGRGSL